MNSTIQAPDIFERENIACQLKFLGHAIGEAFRDGEATPKDYTAIMLFLHDLADKVFPEGKNHE